MREGGRSPLPDAPAERSGQRRRGGRQELPQGLAREVVVRACAAADPAPTVAFGIISLRFCSKL